MFFLGVDNSPARTRTVVLNLEDASVVAEAEQPHSLVEDLPAGHREQDPMQWIHAVDQTVRHCLQSIGPARERISGIGVSGQPQGLVALDAGNRILRPAKLHGDSSADRESEELSRAFGGPPGLIELAGNPMSPTRTAAKILWLKQREPHHFQQTASLLQPHDFINFWLSGVKRTEFGDASESGLLDIRNRRWCRQLLDYIDPGLEELLPPVKSSREAHGVLRGDLAKAWGLGEDILVSAGGANDMMAAIGAGAVDPGSVAVSLGDGGAICGVSGSPLIDPQGEIAAYCDATDHWMPLAGDGRAAAFVAQTQRHYAWTAEQMEMAITAAPPGAGGLIVLPAVRPSRAAYVPAGRGLVYGITGDNFSAINVARAAVEAAALEMGRGLNRMVALGLVPSEVRIMGRHGDSPAWRQVIADVLGLPVYGARATACPSTGAALQAAVTFFHRSGEDLSYGEITSYAVEPAEESRCDPDPARHAHYKDLLERQRTLAGIVHHDGC
ncbi:MAG: xylulokinase [Akkermansiaceae bacterium]|nr:xylulokinase [Akkermansiaceae bacterium]NNM28193.1 xylulokinase [Akkermansiaceae bacterium]